MATSPNFSWPEPDNTDLVKNGALAIRTAVNAIDSSMVDLKGGTTGQILAKTSNTDMDFTWVANDVGDITGVTATTPLTGGGTSGAITVGIQDATTSVKGAVQLSDSTSTTSSILAATPTAVKAAYDLANTANTNNNATMIQQYTATESVLKNVPSRIPAAEQLLKQAVYWIDAAQSDNSDQVLDNQGWGAPSLTTQLGSSASADSNDPKFLDFDGTNYVYTSGVSANYLSIPDSAEFDITGDIDIRAYVALDDWSVSNYLLAKFLYSGSDNRSYRFGLSAGLLSIGWSSAGTSGTEFTKSSTVSTGVTNGTAKWVRVTLDVDNGASGNDVKFYLSDDGITWTQLGTTVTTAGTTSIYASTANVFVGAENQGTTGNFAGKIYRAQIFNGIDGTKVLDVNTSIIGSGSATSFSALTGQTVTINRSTSGKKTTVVTHPVWLFGTDDYMTVADNDLLDFAAADSYTIFAVARRWDTQAYQLIISKKLNDNFTNAGYSIFADTSNRSGMQLSDGTNTLSLFTGSSYPSGSETSLFAVRNVSTDTISMVSDTTISATDTTTGSLSNTTALVIGRQSTGQYADMELIAAAVFRRVLTASEMTTIANYYTARIGG